MAQAGSEGIGGRFVLIRHIGPADTAVVELTPRPHENAYSIVTAGVLRGNAYRNIPLLWEGGRTTPSSNADSRPDFSGRTIDRSAKRPSFDSSQSETNIGTNQVSVNRAALRDEIIRSAKERGPTLRVSTAAELIGTIEGRRHADHLVQLVNQDPESASLTCLDLGGGAGRLGGRGLHHPRRGYVLGTAVAVPPYPAVTPRCDPLTVGAVDLRSTTDRYSRWPFGPWD